MSFHPADLQRVIADSRDLSERARQIVLSARETVASAKQILRALERRMPRRERADAHDVVGSALR